MSNTDKLMQRFLSELHSSEVQEVFKLLDLLVEVLETKNDPELFEIHLVDAATQAIEKLSLLEDILKDHSTGKLTGNELQRLYDRTPTDVGSQVLFD